MESNTKPFVQCASICEKVLHDRDGVLSAIRFVDQYYVNLVELRSATGAVIKPTLALNMLIALKAGSLRGDFDLTLHIRNPSDRVTPVWDWKVTFTDEKPAINFAVGMTLQPDSGYGDYFFDVGWNGELLSRFGLKLAPLSEAPAHIALSPGTGTVQ